MSEVAIYTKPHCPYCSHAKALLESREITYVELDVTQDPDLLTEMVHRSGGRTFPQIVIGERAVGGYDDLRALDRQGRLAALLEPQGADS
ncbi:MAG: glutaredoxin 3 [gamma proteobacterium symbiont of Ctena orbiculata]|uniref:Glutaredoxin n=1 Tax=Candidatus Thiodiazotropha taylori TaxID=2792791 RepID=A0A944M7V8_9GAMM|nr:glutaredoxin 3 [Candidatus Thiodiazotropha taylori]PUB79736.1 MAG: glutaredoxin 3 [gamma proteobacterium symbiont of Ctena orbiculata]MBT3028316.1 glutaredoxin 3 [Candidatus Thiodiazotropha taylori]MBT3036148.1 glutaredoxin 3 [Candidatus Thiodiazotropha taylori]MBV2138028.1 glutaredoxin 3 [Candidatus Thiodiazotropha taylori]